MSEPLPQDHEVAPRVPAPGSQDPESASTSSAPPEVGWRTTVGPTLLPSAAAASVSLELAVELHPAPNVDADRLAAVVSSIVERHFRSGGTFELTVHMVDDPDIRALNAEHRGKDTHTDVLSFPLYEPNAEFVLPPGEPVQLGDVVVSYPRAVEQAHEYGHSVQRELAYLVAHGTLHLLGYDHEIESDRDVMRQREEEALVPLGLTR
ncbi:MAG: hypothetical protein NVSMB2_10300 [Chloroflexota bacterium]